MRIFKASYRDRNGRKRKSKKYYVDFTDHLRIRHRISAFTDWKNSETLGEKIEKLVVCKLNTEPPDRELSEWISQIPQRLRTQLARMGLLDKKRMAAGQALKKHLSDFEQSLRAKGNTDGHAKQTMERIKKVIEDCCFRTWTDISASKIQTYLADLRQGEEDISAQTFNYYLQAVKQFCRWMIQDGRAPESPIEHLKRVNINTDIRRPRRALKPDEVRRLLEATIKGPERYGMTGYERYLLYRLAVETGLRVNEIRSLKVSSFDLKQLSVTVNAGYSKRRREDTLPLRSELAELLKDFFKNKIPGTKAFGGSYKQLTDKTALMLKADLAATEIKDSAGKVIKKAIPYIDDAGRYADFHSLRHTTSSFLVAAGTHPKVVQSLMRHSDINLTMSRYTHIFREQESDAIAKLPDLSLPSTDQQSAKATGTDSKEVMNDDCFANCLAKKTGENRNVPKSTRKTNQVHDIETSISNTPGRTRTCDLRIRNPLLYPTELRAQICLSVGIINTSEIICQ